MGSTTSSGSEDDSAVASLACSSALLTSQCPSFFQETRLLRLLRLLELESENAFPC